MTSRGLVLWDIDHTLVDGSGLSKRIWGGAFERLTGRPVLHDFTPDGSTDPLIFRGLVDLHQISDDDWSDADIEAAYRSAFAAVEADWLDRARPKPGARDAIAEVAALGGIVQSVLTGNIAANAVAKLRLLGLDAHLDFTIGAYGDDPHDVRGDLVRVARDRARDALGHTFDRTTTVLVGDTPGDVLAGHHGGARVVGVASGMFPAADLSEAGADHVLTDLTGLPAAVTSLLDEAAA